VTEYHDQTLSAADLDGPPPWWGEEVQAGVDAAPVIAEVVLLDAERRPGVQAVPDEFTRNPETGEPEPAGPTREQAAQRLVAIAALEQLVRKLKAEHREQAASVYDKPHMKDPVMLDGRELGQARTDAVKAAWKVADAAAWATYVDKVYDDGMVEQITTVVDPELTKRALAGLTSGEWVTLDPDTGEVVDGPPPGLEYTPAGHKLVVTAAKDAAQQVTHLLGPVARQLGLPELEAD
jgi:hypothetical protein